MIRRRSRPPQPRPKLLGLDASLNSTGYAFLDAAGQLVTDRITPGSKKGSARLHHNHVQLCKLLDNVRPDKIILEGYAMGGVGLTFQIGEWGGLVRLEAWRRGIDVIVITPTTLKYAATSSGAAKKPQMLKACEDLFGQRITQHDEADAYLLLRAGEAYLYKTGPKDFVHRVLNPKNPKKPGYSIEPGARLAVCN
jgi:Holliday junction resolvasome RuvABC endonuclease subunit